MEHHELDILDYDVLVLPFESNDHKSVFAILGARHIRDYMKHGFNEHRHIFFMLFHTNHRHRGKSMLTMHHVQNYEPGSMSCGE